MTDHTPHLTGNLALIQHEILHALQQLVDHGTQRTIDLSSLPMAKAEIQALTDWLGRGELRATLEADGTSEIIETAFPGVWLITHRDEAAMLRGRYIDITPLPEILLSQPADMRAGLTRMQTRLGADLSHTRARKE